MMKTHLRRWRLALPLLLALPAALHANGNSFFVPRPITSSLAIVEPTYRQFNDLWRAEKTPKMNRKDHAQRTPLRFEYWQTPRGSEHISDVQLRDRSRFAINITPFYQTSVTSKDLRRFFFPGGKDELTVGGARAGAAGDGSGFDISATWLGIAGINEGHPDTELFVNAFSSKISIAPSFERYGAGLNLVKEFKMGSGNFFASITTQLLEVRNHLKLREFDLQDNYTSIGQINAFIAGETIVAPSPYVPLSATQAFQNPTWQFGRIQNNQKQGLADTELMLGLHCNRYLTFSILGVLPTSKKDQAHYMFESRLGNGSHWALGAQVNGEIAFGKKHLFQSQLRYAYLFENHQMRSFDLVNNGPWSRYLLVVRQQQAPDLEPGNPYAIPEAGINWFTQKVSVTPNHQVEWINSLHLQSNKLFCDLGAHLGFNNKEHVRLASDFAKPIFIPGLTYDSPDFLTLKYNYPTASISTSNFVPEDGTLPDGSTLTEITGRNQLKPLSTSALNLNSGALPRQFFSTLFLTLGLRDEWKKMPYSLSLGAGYEFNTKQDNFLCSLTFSLAV